jgi:hypothetical protein
MAVYVADLRSLSGWTERLASTEGAPSLIADGFRVTKSAETNEYMLAWDAIDSDANRDNVEVLAKVRFTTQAAAGAMMGIAVRASGASGSETFYSCYLSGAGNAGADARPVVGEVNAGTTQATIGLVGSQSNAANTWYWLRFRVNGQSLKARAWADGQTEPAAWGVDDTDATIAAAGYVGFYCRDTAADPYDLAYFAVATNGDTIGGGSSGFFLGADF